MPPSKHRSMYVLQPRFGVLIVLFLPVQKRAPILASRMHQHMCKHFPTKENWPVPGVPVTGIWFGFGPSVLHQDMETIESFITIPLSRGMVGGTVLVFPQLLQGFLCQPGDFCAFDGAALLHGLTLPTLRDHASRICLSMWIDKRLTEANLTPQ